MAFLAILAPSVLEAQRALAEADSARYLAKLFGSDDAEAVV
jgi:hypothetical protein